MRRTRSLPAHGAASQHLFVSALLEMALQGRHQVLLDGHLGQLLQAHPQMGVRYEVSGYGSADRDSHCLSGGARQRLHSSA